MIDFGLEDSGDDKSQIPSTKFQTNLNFQVPNLKRQRTKVVGRPTASVAFPGSMEVLT
jgi:hypothetical protein